MTYDLSKANCCRRRGEIFQTEAAAAKSAGQEPGSVDVAVGHSNGSDLLDLTDVCPCVIGDFCSDRVELTLHTCCECLFQAQPMAQQRLCSKRPGHDASP